MTRFYSTLLFLLLLLPINLHAADYDYISEQPQGEVTYYDRLAYGWYIFAGGNNIQYGPIPGASKMVWAADGSVYIQDPLTANKMGTYIKARREGEKIVADFPQVLGEIEDNAGKRPLYIGVMKRVSDDRGDTYLPTTEQDRVTWTIHDDGRITMDHKAIPLTPSGKFADMDNLPDDVLGTYYNGIDDVTGEYGPIWNAVADWAQTYTPVELQEILTIPDHLNRETWRMTTRKDTRMVTVAFDGDVVYLADFTAYVPGAIKGYRQGEKIFFPTTQYLGFNEQHNANAWFISAIGKYEDYFGNGRLYLTEFIRTDALEFDFDPEAKTMTTETNTCFLINASTTETNHFEYIEDPNLQYLPAEGMDAAPRNPVIVNPGEEQGNDGLLFSVDIPAENVNGVAFNTNQMFYNIYLNGQLWDFRRDTYPYFAADYTDLPYNFTDKYDLQLRGSIHDIYFHEEGIHSIGVQSCFRGNDGQVYRSEIISVGKTPGTAESDIEEGRLDTVAASLPTTSTFAYAATDADTEPSGTGKAETYDIAIALTNPALVGKTITKIHVPVLPTTKASALSVWLAKELTLKLVDGRLTNIVNARFPVEMPRSGDMQFVTVELDHPCVIPDGGLYVGYSLTIDATDRSEATQVPIVTAKNPKDGGFFLHTSRSFIDWQDRGKQLNVAAMTQVELSGDILLNAATLGEMPYSYLALDQEQTVDVPVHNLGQEPIASLQYRTAIGESVYEGSTTLTSPIPAVYAYYENVPFTLPAAGQLGDCDIHLTITGVNGQANEATTDVEQHGQGIVLKFVPKKRGLVEEFTGTWCGWCPAGFVAMEKMAEIDPEFIGVAYHDNDPMAMRSGYPNIVSGFPEAAFNREFNAHPYYPMGYQDTFSLPVAWDYLCDGFTPVGIDLDAAIDAEGLVTVHSKVEWVMPADDPDADYRVEYILVADDLTGNTQGWAQHNYFSTEAKMMPYMEQFWHQDVYVRGLHFNDVAVMTSGLRGVAGSIATTEPGVGNEYTFTFDTTKAINIDNQPIPIHNDKLRVVAFVLKGSGYGQVVNAAKCDVDYTAGISQPTTANAPDALYNLQGQRVGSSFKGITIRNGRKQANR